MPKQPVKKKTSIREFVSEESIKFELYHMKYSKQLQQFDNLTTDEIQEKWKYDKQKKINRFQKDLSKPENADPIAQAALQYNIDYLTDLPAPTTEEGIKENFKKALEDYKNTITFKLQEPDVPWFTIEKLNESLTYIAKLEKIGLLRNPSKEKFGILLLLMIKNLNTMPSFSGYSENWATDFHSNAVEKVLLYLDNFDEKLQSKRSGGPVKAFAYVTQICFNAFVNVINIRKKENKFLGETISLESANLDGVKDYNVENKIEQEEIILKREYTIKIKTLKELNPAITKGINHIIMSNEILENNKGNISEIKYIKESTPEEDKNEDYEEYIRDLERKVSEQIEDIRIDTLRIIKPSDLLLGNFEFPSSDILKGIQLIITEKTKKVKKKVQKTEEVLQEISEIEEFDKEW